MENIQNYYEKVVTTRLQQRASATSELSEDAISDAACIALNKLPTRYYRHDIDLSFYTSSEEQKRLDQSVEEAIKFALEKVQENPRV